MIPDKNLDRIGDLNPQLFRELKGRLTGRSLTDTLIGSVLIQLVYLAVLSIISIGIAFIAQLGILVGLTKLLQQRLQTIGASTTQMFDRQRLPPERTSI